MNGGRNEESTEHSAERPASRITERIDEAPGGQACLGIIAAFPRETRPLLKAARGRALPRGFREGRSIRVHCLALGEDQALLAIAGAGAENARRAALRLVGQFPVCALVSVGFAGGLAAELRPGDVVQATHVIEQESGRRFDCDPDLLRVAARSRGGILGADSVITSASEKRRLGELWKAVAVDMESAGVARAAAEARLPFAAVKCITDSVEQSLSIDFNLCRREDKNFSFWSVAKQGLTTRHGIRDLWRLAWNSKLAAVALETALLSSRTGRLA